MANPIDQITLEEWNAVFEVNATGVFLMCRALAPHMRERRYGKIINLASLAARRANANIPHYSASKAACMNFTMSLAREMAAYNVNVNAINPGLLWTNIWEKDLGVIIGGGDGKPARQVFTNTSRRRFHWSASRRRTTWATWRFYSRAMRAVTSRDREMVVAGGPGGIAEGKCEQSSYGVCGGRISRIPIGPRRARCLIR